jgi:hypothetical protein
MLVRSRLLAQILSAQAVTRTDYVHALDLVHGGCFGFGFWEVVVEMLGLCVEAPHLQQRGLLHIVAALVNSRAAETFVVAVLWESVPYDHLHC